MQHVTHHTCTTHKCCSLFTPLSVCHTQCVFLCIIKLFYATLNVYSCAFIKLFSWVSGHGRTLCFVLVWPISTLWPPPHSLPLKCSPLPHTAGWCSVAGAVSSGEGAGRPSSGATWPGGLWVGADDDGLLLRAPEPDQQYMVSQCTCSSQVCSVEPECS